METRCPRQVTKGGVWVRWWTVGSLIVVCAVVGGCGSSDDSSRARELAKTCLRPLDSLTPSQGTDCIAAGYYKELLRRRRSQSPSHLSTGPAEPSNPPRRTLQLKLTPAPRSGIGSGSILIVEHPRAGTVVFETAASDTIDLILRPGTCSRIGRGRGYHLSYSGEANISFDRLVSSTFTVEIHNTEGGKVSACADHRGRQPLGGDTSRARRTGRVHSSKNGLEFRKRGLQIELVPAGAGRETDVSVTADAPGNADVHAHIRRGSCRFVPASKNGRFCSPIRKTEPRRHLEALYLPFPTARSNAAAGFWKPARVLVGSEVDACVEL